MIRFIDIRKQGTGYRFAFWDTVTDSFIGIGTDQAWDDEADLRDTLAAYPRPSGFRERLLRLCPDWVFDPNLQTEEDLE